MGRTFRNDWENQKQSEETIRFRESGKKRERKTWRQELDRYRGQIDYNQFQQEEQIEEAEEHSEF
jgi:hypothetical protein